MNLFLLKIRIKTYILKLIILFLKKYYSDHIKDHTFSRYYTWSWTYELEDAIGIKRNSVEDLTLTFYENDNLEIHQYMKRWYGLVAKKNQRKPKYGTVKEELEALGLELPKESSHLANMQVISKSIEPNYFIDDNKPRSLTMGWKYINNEIT